jgi:hypothetical protein
MEDLLTSLRKLRLDKIPKKWWSHIWESEFTINPNFEDFDDSLNEDDLDTYDDINFNYATFLNEIDVCSIYNEIQVASRNWLERPRRHSIDPAILESSMCNSDVPSLTASSSNISITDQDTGFWNDLTRANIPFKSLIALLFHHMTNGQSSGLQTIELQKAFKSAGLYFTLVSLPGSSAFKIFHSVLYNKALDILKVALKLVTLCLMSYF